MKRESDSLQLLEVKRYKEGAFQLGRWSTGDRRHHLSCSEKEDKGRHAWLCSAAAAPLGCRASWPPGISRNTSARCGGGPGKSGITHAGKTGLSLPFSTIVAGVYLRVGFLHREMLFARTGALPQNVHNQT
jgi:hypothetical protein